MSQTLTPPPPSVVAEPRVAVARRRRVPNLNKSLLLLRVLVGLLFVGHACQKLLGWFGGEGMAAWVGSLQKAGIEPALLWANISAFAELGAGVLLVVGLLTPLPAAVLIADMAVAIVKIHAAKGLWSQNGGFEYNLVLIGLMIVLGVLGPGAYSLDQHLPFRLPRPHTFLVAMVLSLGGAAFAIFVH